jgi:hypothetical protein
MVAQDEAVVALQEAAKVVGTLGDILGGYDAASVAVGRLAGRVETLLWAQAELQVELSRMRSTDRFADTRALEDFLVRVQDSLRQVQDGTGDPAGLVRSGVEAVKVETDTLEIVPTTEMGA